jgi:hypothetical protein
MQNMHILSHWFFTKIKRFAVAGAKPGAILAEMSRPDRPMRRPRWRRRSAPSSAE